MCSRASTTGSSRGFLLCVAALCVAPSDEPGAEQGPLIDLAALTRIETFVADAVAKGATLVTGGARHARGGLFYQPTVLTNAGPDMRFTTEEIFGPVAPVYRFDTEDEVIAAANATDYGLAAYAYTQGIARMFRLQDRLESGLIGINEVLIVTPEAPFGGLKESGLGKEGGWQGIEDYLETKYTCIGGL